MVAAMQNTSVEKEVGAGRADVEMSESRDRPLDGTNTQPHPHVSPRYRSSLLASLAVDKDASGPPPKVSVDETQSPQDVTESRPSDEPMRDESNYIGGPHSIPGGTHSNMPRHVEPTLVDLAQGIPRPGLGSSNMDLLGLHKEDIGLKNPTVLLDIPSPTYGGTKFFGANLSEAEIEKCRRAIQVTTSRSTKGGASQEYFVEFPPEEQQGPNVLNQSLLYGLEESLASGLMDNLNLKRPNCEGGPLTTKKLQLMPRKRLREHEGERGPTLPQHQQLSTNILATQDFMVEEAGLNFPPLEP